MAKFKKTSVLPIYAIAVVWVIYTLVHPLYRVSDYVSVILLSAVAFIVVKGFFPTVEYELPDPPQEEAQQEPPQEQAQEEAEEEDKPEETASSEERPETPLTGDPKIDGLITEKDRTLSEMRRLNDAIDDETLSRQIDQLEDVTAKIIDHVIQHPDKFPQIRKFMIYYLPTTLKILNAYDRMGATGVAGENIGSTMDRIESMMDTIVSSFQKQLDALFRDEAMDIASDITVMETMLAQEGLSGPQGHA
ncbi:MAG: 5-bromo-4-chloroindolyl phosphate hydrolysis family protein [Evtepia sp.]|uniref:5-bromo-4-chloroindolyl phosphate hydrolysis family protein n=1 Tax=Evtepia sp. TaxID=2773933 RepID=UPI002A764ABD|nr:5-bromo-4-chloroindolyl phosphate hydrolysis family protein [Evtepia sp.]MDY3015377.1 5-bromo-4-chloroindolyl phosphate hydrolysis family protein [Evtepia sp.]